MTYLHYFEIQFCMFLRNIFLPKILLNISKYRYNVYDSILGQILFVYNSILGLFLVIIYDANCSEIHSREVG